MIVPRNVDEVVAALRSKGSERNVAGMARYGIVAKHAFGVPAPAITELARSLGRNHALAQALWKTAIHDARILAAFIEEPDRVTEGQMDRWARDFDNWAICDGVCLHLFDRTRYAATKAVAWSSRKEEFVRRAGFVLMAVLAVHDKDAEDRMFLRFLQIIKRRATDDRNFVRKAVNWALRQIGKRNVVLHRRAIATAHEIARLDSRAAHWIAKDALKELMDPTVMKRLRTRAARRPRRPGEDSRRVPSR